MLPLPGGEGRLPARRFQPGGGEGGRHHHFPHHCPHPLLPTENSEEPHKNVANRSEESFNRVSGRTAILVNMKWAKMKMQPILCLICSGKWFEKAMFLAGVVGVGLAIFLSVRSSPAMMTVAWLPKWVGHWLDQYGRFRNFPAFAMLAIPFLIITPKFLQRACIIVLLAMLVDSLELVQLFIPTRYAEGWDIFWGWAGLLAAWGIFEAVIKFTPETSAQNAAGELNEN
jgi:hypothetical protein